MRSEGNDVLAPAGLAVEPVVTDVHKGFLDFGLGHD
jgi:hypothetical protein